MSVNTPIVECMGGVKLTADQKAKIDAIVESQPAGDLIAVRVFPNLDTTSEEELPAGMQLVFKPSAKVDSTLISDNLFQVFAVSRILTDDASAVTSSHSLKDEYFASANLKNAVDQFPSKPLGPDTRSTQTMKEKQVWAPELGGPGSFVGVYSKARDGDFRNKDYFIAARGTAPLLVKDLKQRIAAAAPTFQELLYKDEWRNLMHYNANAARRNVCRSIANAAEACQVSIVRDDDRHAFVADANHAPPEMAVPDWEQATYTIRNGVYQGKPAVLVSYGVVPSEDCLLMKDQLFFVVANPYDGVAAFKLTKHEQIESAMGLPADTGRKLAPEQVPRNEQAYKGRMQGVSWDYSGVSSSIMTELHPEAHRGIDAPFKQAMQFMGWDASEHVEKLVPLPLKIYNNELKR